MAYQEQHSSNFLDLLESVPLETEFGLVDAVILQKVHLKVQYLSCLHKFTFKL